ncbi:MAG TPA: hypothetical protein DIU20_09880 [Cryomorphaceae bacterium]|nr:hypothetical protein [Cryomorphaceae bacterium]
MSVLLKYWNAVSLSGIESRKSDWERRKLILINQYNVIAILGQSAYLLINLVLGFYLLAFCDLLGVIIGFWGIALNRRKSDWAVDFPFLMISINILLGHIVYGPDSLCFLISVPLVMGVTISYQLKNSLKLVLLLSFPALLFILEDAGAFSFLDQPLLSPGLITFLRWHSLGFTFVCTTLFFLLLMQSHKLVSNIVNEKENILNDIISSTNEIIWGLDTQYNLTYFNRAFRQSFKMNYNMEPYLGMSLQDFFEEHDIIFWKDFYDNALRGKEVYFEKEIMGSIYQNSVHPIFRKGEIQGVACVSHNISSQFQGGIPSRELSRDIAALVFQSITHPDCTSEFTYISARVWDIFGIKAESLMTGECSFMDFLLPEEKERFLYTYKLSLKNTSVFDENFRIQVKGDIKTLNIKAFPETTDRKKVTQWHGVVNDITNSLSLSRENQDLKDLLFSLNRNLSESIFRSSEEGGLLYANDAYIDLFGFRDMEDAKQQRYAIPYADNDVRQMLLNKLKTQGFFQNEEARFLRKNGTIFYGLVSAYIASYKNHKAIIDGSIRDITKIKEVEEELRQAKIKADKANKAKTDFLSTMSHEIRTPLNAIIGVSQILAGKNLDPETEDNISVIYNSSNILLSLINDILDFSKIEAGHIELERIDFDLRQLVINITRTLSFLKGDKNIKLRYTLDENLKNYYLGDPGRLSQILLNLSNNAIKFTFEGEVSIHVKVMERKKGQDLLLFEVKDTGIGISAEAQKTIFKSFTQAEVGITRKYGGTGLGLSIVKKLTGLFRGKVWVESELDRGSVFSVEIPLRHSIGSTIERLYEEEKDLSNVSILVAEDNMVNGMVVTRLLSQWGAEVKVVENGSLVMEELGTHNYDLLLLDLHMPVMDGFETIKAVRQDPRWKHLPVLALTADTFDTTNEKVHQAGMNGFIPKPFQQDDIYTKIKKAISV